MLHLLLAAGLATAPLATPSPALPEDSIGVVVQAGKTYLKHKIGKGDTFYSLARRYHVPMSQVVAANPKIQGMLTIGQVVLVPRSTVVLADVSKPPAAEKPVARPEAPKPAVAFGSTKSQSHTVSSGETLSGIARKYHTSVAALRRLNHLKSDALRLKQVLVVREASTAPVVAAEKGSGNPAVAPQPEEAIRAEARVREEIRKEDARKEEARRDDTKRPEPSVAPTRAGSLDAADDTSAGTEVAESLRKVTESGTAEVIEGSSESNKYLALHRTAPVGTILQVRNPQNTQSVYVRVIGKLPATGSNENVIIRLSRRAVQKLGSVDGRFRVEVSYMP